MIEGVSEISVLYVWSLPSGKLNVLTIGSVSVCTTNNWSHT